LIGSPRRASVPDALVTISTVSDYARSSAIRLIAAGLGTG
jgi:hypothetical protein